MTYSILARDPETGAIGIACQSHFFGVGRLVGWLEPGVGGVATQAFVNVGLGPQGLDRLRAGQSARATLDALVGDEALAAYRQLAVVDATGEVAGFTGDRCVPGAGYRYGHQVVAHGNMLASDAVYESMVDAYESGTGTFPERLLAALRAAEDAGGDARGSQSAMMRVVSGQRSERPWEETLVDLRVDDHPDPVAELGRLLAVHTLLFGRPDPATLLDLTGAVADEVATLLTALGHQVTDGPEAALVSWAGLENLEERLVPGRIDPVVLTHLRGVAPRVPAPRSGS